MNEQSSHNTSSNPSVLLETNDEEEVHLLDYLLILIRWHRFIFFSIVIGCAVVSILSFFIPNRYTAQTTILPPEEQPSNTGLSALLLNAPIGALGLGGGGGAADLFIEMLQSRTVIDGVINQLDLIKKYDVDNLDRARLVLEDMTSVSTSASKAGIVTVKVEALTPDLAAQIAQAYIKELDRTNTGKNISRAKNTRIFIEERLNQTKINLKRAEEILLRFQEEHKTIAHEEQTKAVIYALAQVKTELITLEVEQDVLKQSLHRTHPRVLAVQPQIDALKKQLNLMAYGYDLTADVSRLIKDSSLPSDENPSRSEFSLSFDEIPSLGLQLARMMREIKVETTVFELLTREYEQAKIREARDTPTVLVLDEAIPPLYKSSPKRLLMIIVSGITFFFISVVCALLFENIIQSRKEPEVQKKYESISFLLRSNYESIARWIQFRK